MTGPDLSAEEQRVLGALLEKEVTVPASYPMSVNTVITACNQSSSREPVTEYDEATVHRVLRALKEQDLVAVTWQDSGRRTLKYVQTVAARHGWAPDERALLTVLLLRGAQAPGALKTRTERLHPFADRTEVEACLTRMAAAEPPLVQQQPKRPREQDHRWIHLLGPADDDSGSTPSSAQAPDRETVIAHGAEARDTAVRTSYDAVAASYAQNFVDELAEMPFERMLLDRVAAGPGPVVEVGCGPGHVTAHLAAQGADAHGIDLSPEMIDQALNRYRDGRYEVGDLRRLMRPTNAEGWGAVLAWYSLIHFAPSELPSAIEALVRPLAPGGTLLLAMHAGTEVLSPGTWFDHEISLDFVLHQPAEVVALVEQAGLVDVEWYHRGPVTTRGERQERLYVLARKPRPAMG
ncbi:DUF480 domain-containing protein [Nocardioides sp.]|uniref:DUF480 domain-containing protein n=1 Tax=Nocardioides sp. TaxID=35761 RepID=UPI002B264E18|nr:DUF480 domain-containing protein [Nocardioides sp.]